MAASSARAKGSGSSGWALLAPALYLLLAFPRLDVPGLHIDEASDALVGALILAPDAPGLPIVYDKWVVGGRVLPLMGGPYLGAVMPYALAPVLRWAGPDTAALRLPGLALSVVTLLFLFGVCRAWFGTRTALLAAGLTAVSLPFVQFSRLALHREELLLLPFFWGGLYFLARGGFTRAGLALGLGLSLKITFLWYLAGLAAALAAPRLRRAAVPGWSAAAARRLAAGLCVGAAFLIAYNVKRPLATPRLLIASVLAPETTRDVRPGVSNLRYPENFARRCGQLWELLSGRITVSHDWGVAPSHLDRLGAAAGLAALLGLAACAWPLARRTRAGEDPRLSFLGAAYGVVFLLTPFTVSGFDPGHMAVLLPFPQIALAVLLDRLAASGSVARRAAGAVLLTAYAGFHLPQNLRFTSVMAREGGIGRWSTSVNELAVYLRERGIRRPVLCGIGLSETLELLTRRAVRPVVLASDSEQALEEAYRAAEGPSVHLLWADSAEESSSRRRRFEERAGREGRRPALERTFFNRAGRPVYWLYALEKPRP